MRERPRNENVALMMKVISELPAKPRRILVDTRTWLVAHADETTRARLMASMAKVLGSLGELERRRVMAEVMGSVAQLPNDRRTAMVAAMSQVLARD
jgi:lauroyl/myristoyl acyltransferase